jgi:hypothetical protein
LSRCVDNLVAAIGHVPFMLVGRGNGRLRQELAEEIVGAMGRLAAQGPRRSVACLRGLKAVTDIHKGSFP